jgi:hypothetical protein
VPGLPAKAQLELSMNMHRGRGKGGRWLQPIVLLACLAANPANGHPANYDLTGWRIEQGVEIPSYAVVEPTVTNLNIDAVVLACEEAKESKVLQIHLYLPDEGPLRPIGVPRGPARDPQVQVSIDDRVFPVALFFADDHAVLADDREGWFPRLSSQLIKALRTGQTMTMRFTLTAEQPYGRPASFNGEATVDLQDGDAREAVAAVLRCAGRWNTDARSPDRRAIASEVMDRVGSEPPLLRLGPAIYREHAVKASYH